METPARLTTDELLDALDVLTKLMNPFHALEMEDRQAIGKLCAYLLKETRHTLCR
jgi:hypothetical protein